MTLTATDKNRGRQRAQRMFTATRCVACGRSGIRIERHHVDGNPLNNDPANVRVLCTRCHMEEDGRLAASADRLRARGRRAPRIYKGTVCAVHACGLPAKNKGLCNAHYYRARNNNGDPGTTPVRAYRRTE
jgi:hypothetical protein